MGRQTSKIRIPSINDFNTLTHEDMDSQLSTSPATKPVGIVHRSWSVESAETPQRTNSSFTETFTRALYEHMRGN